jgi:hypothetical protein
MIQELQNFRQLYPQYNDIEDWELVNLLAKKHPEYSDLVPKVKQEKITEIAGQPELAVSHAPMFPESSALGGGLRQLGLGTVGLGEAVVKLAEMPVKFIPSGILEGIMAIAPPGTTVGDISKALQQGIQQYLTYEPKTEAGKVYAGAIEWPFRKFDEWGDIVADEVRKNSLNAGAGPEEAAVVATTIGGAIKFLPYAFGFKALGGRSPRIPKRIGLPEGAEIERALPIAPELERPGLPPGQGFILKGPKPEVRKGVPAKEPEIFVKKADGTYTPGFWSEDHGGYVTPIEQAAPGAKGLVPGQGFTMKPPKPETILRPKTPTGKGPVKISPEGEPIYPPGMEPVIEPLPKGIESKKVGVAEGVKAEPILAEVPKAKPEAPKPTPQEAAYEKYLDLEEQYSKMLGEEKPDIKEIRKINHKMAELAKETGKPELMPPKEVETPSAAKEFAEKAAKERKELPAKPTFRQFIESKGYKWPMKSTHKDYDSLKAEFDVLRGEQPKAEIPAKAEVAYGAGTVKDLIREHQELQKGKPTELNVNRRNEIYGILKDYYKKEAQEATFQGKEMISDYDWDMIGATTANDALAWSHDAAMKSLPANIKRQLGHIEAEKEVPKAIAPKRKAVAPIVSKKEKIRKPLIKGKPTAEITESEYTVVARREKEIDLGKIKKLEDVRKAFESGELNYGGYARGYGYKWSEAEPETIQKFNEFWEEAEKEGYRLAKSKEKITVRYGREWDPETQEWKTKEQSFRLPEKEDYTAIAGAPEKGIEALGYTTIGPGEAMVKKFRELARADKQFAENPVLRVERMAENPEAFRLVFTAKDAETGMPRRYRIDPDAISGEIKTLIQEKKLKEGENIKLSPGYLEGKSPEIYLAKKGLESIVDKYYEEGVKREKAFKQKGEVALPKISIEWPEFKATIEKAKEIPKGINEKLKKFRFYPDLPMEFRNAIRNEVVGAIDKARDKVFNRLAHAIWGGLKKADVEKSVEIIFARDQVSRARKAKGNPNISLQEAEKILGDVEKGASKEAVDAVERYRDITEAYQKDLVDRGILEPDQLIEDYAPHFVVDYTPDWTFNVGIPARLKRPFRGYKKRAFGTTKEYRQDADAILGHFLKVEHDNLIEDFIQRQAAKYDITPTLSESERITLFGAEKTGRPKMPKPGRIVEIGRERYRVYTPDIPFSRQLFPTEEGLMALGRYKRTYVLPENIYNAFTHFSDRGSAFTYWTNRATSYWKSAAILSHFPSFNVNNMIGDTWMATLQHPKPTAFFAEYPTALSYLTGKGKEGYFKELDSFIKNHNILQGIFTEAEMARVRKAHDPLRILLSMANQASKFRESINRTAYTSSLLKEMKEGRGKEIRDAHSWINTEGLPLEDALGKISRDVLVDYQWVSRGFHRFIRGMAFPFGTWYFKSSPLLWKWTQKNWGKALVGFMSLPLAATAFNNRDEKTKELESRLPDYARHRVHFVMGENPDKTTRVWSFQLPQDVLIGTKIFSIATDYANRVANKELSPKEAALKTIREWGLQEAKGILFLTAPLIRFFAGLTSKDHRDPYDNSPIYSMKPEYMTWQRRLKDQALYFIKSSVPFLSVSIANYEKGMPKDVALRKILDNLAGKGALGIYDVSPKGEIKIGGKLYDYDDVTKINWIRNKEMGYLGDLENDFVASAKVPKEFVNSAEAKSRLLKIYNLWSDFVPDLKKEKDETVKIGVVMEALGKRLTNRLTDLSVLQKWQRVRIERAKTDEERKRLGAEFEQLRKRALAESFKGRPKTAREMEILGRIKEHELPWNLILELP